MPSSGTEVKKIKAFPFPISVKVGTHNVAGQVLKMTSAGMLVETNSLLLGVGDNVEAEFTLPVMKHVVICSGLVVKFYNQMTGGGAALRIAEIHFRGLTDGNREKILHYLTAAGVRS